MTISLGQLDLEALKNYLKIVQGFRTVNDAAGDTEAVNGTPSKYIAKVADTLIHDEDLYEMYGRSTVDYALSMLEEVDDGVYKVITAKDMLTFEEGKSLQETAEKSAQSTANDMKELRNEMYHLKRDMIRNGSMPYDQVYNGFIDPFLNGLNVYTEDPLTIESISSVYANVTNGNAEIYRPNQKAVLLYEDSLSSMCRVDSVPNNTMIKFESERGLTSADKIQKTYGLYDKGRFVFAGNNPSLSNTNSQANMIYKDGIDRVKVAELNQAADVIGFATTIVVPAELDENYLKGVSVSLRTIGYPGSCYLELYDYSANMLYGEPLTTSNYLSSDRASNAWSTHQFIFNEEQKLEKGHIYLLLIKSTVTDRANMWLVGGFAEQCNYSIHQDTYIYTTESRFQKEGPDLVTNQVYDMFIGLYTTRTKQAVLSYSNKGLYTGHFDIENNIATRARVSFNPRIDNKYYSVHVIGKTANSEFIEAVPDGDVKLYNHTVWSNNEHSGLEYVYDFVFPKEVNYVEFQIIYDNPNPVGEENYEALFALVVSTDSAYASTEGGNE